MQGSGFSVLCKLAEMDMQPRQFSLLPVVASVNHFNLGLGLALPSESPTRALFTNFTKLALQCERPRESSFVNCGSALELELEPDRSRRHLHTAQPREAYR